MFTVGAGRIPRDVTNVIKNTALTTKRTIAVSNFLIGVFPFEQRVSLLQNQRMPALWQSPIHGLGPF